MKIILVVLGFLLMTTSGVLIWGFVRKSAVPKIAVSGTPVGQVGPIYEKPPSDAQVATCDPTELTLNHGEFGHLQLVFPSPSGQSAQPDITNLYLPFYDAGGDNNFQRTSDNSYGEVHVRTKSFDIWPSYFEKPYRIRFDSKEVHAATDEQIELPVFARACLGKDCTVSAVATCRVTVKHPGEGATSAAQATTETAPPPPTITTQDGFEIKYLGPLQAQHGGELAAQFQVQTPEGSPAKGTLKATLGNPPSDSNATHAQDKIDKTGQVSLKFDVRWPVGSTKLNVSHTDQVYKVADIDIVQYKPEPVQVYSRCTERNDYIRQYNMWNELRWNSEAAAGKARKEAEDARQEANRARKNADDAGWLDRVLGIDDQWTGYAIGKEREAEEKEMRARYWDGVVAEAKAKMDEFNKKIEACK